MLLLKKSTSAVVVMGPFVDSLDAVTPETGLGILQADILLSKNGGAFAQKDSAVAASHMTIGHYSVDLSAVDTNTAGRLRIAIFKSEALPVWMDLMVLPAQVYDSLVAGSDQLDVSLPTADQDLLILALLKRDFTGITGEASRSMLNALRKLINKWSISGATLTVTKEDDTTTAFTQAVTTTPGADPISALDTA